VATGLSAGNLARCRWVTSVSRDFTGAAAAAPNTPQTCRAHGEVARSRRSVEWSVKPSAKPTQVRTLDLPHETPGQAGMSTGLPPERERSATPSAGAASRGPCRSPRRSYPYGRARYVRHGEYAEKFTSPQNAGQDKNLRTRDSPAGT